MVAPRSREDFASVCKLNGSREIFGFLVSGKRNIVAPSIRISGCRPPQPQSIYRALCGSLGDNLDGTGDGSLFHLSVTRARRGVRPQELAGILKRLPLTDLPV